MRELSEAGAVSSLDKYAALLVSGKDDYHHNRVRSHTATGNRSSTSTQDEKAQS
jgi:hypothetical protein